MSKGKFKSTLKLKIKSFMFGRTGENENPSVWTENFCVVGNNAISAVE